MSPKHFKYNRYESKHILCMSVLVLGISTWHVYPYSGALGGDYTTRMESSCIDLVLFCFCEFDPCT